MWPVFKISSAAHMQAEQSPPVSFCFRMFGGANKSFDKLANHESSSSLAKAQGFVSARSPGCIVHSPLQYLVLLVGSGNGRVLSRVGALALSYDH